MCVHATFPHWPSVVICCTTVPPNTHRKWCYDFPFSISLMPSYFLRAPDLKHTETQNFPIFFTKASPVLTQKQLNKCWINDGQRLTSCRVSCLFPSRCQCTSVSPQHLFLIETQCLPHSNPSLFMKSTRPVSVSSRATNGLFYRSSVFALLEVPLTSIQDACLMSSLCLFWTITTQPKRREGRGQPMTAMKNKEQGQCGGRQSMLFFKSMWRSGGHGHENKLKWQNVTDGHT